MEGQPSRAKARKVAILVEASVDGAQVAASAECAQGGPAPIAILLALTLEP